MKILVIGSGGREHALVWKIAQSSKVEKIYCAPGNPGIGQIAQNVPLHVNDLNKLLEFALENKIDLTVVGPEVPLINGIADLFQEHNLFIIGPGKLAARIEGSKVFAKELMKKYHIQTAIFRTFNNFAKVNDYLLKVSYPQVIKADGVCAGKGVAICRDKKEALDFLSQLMRDKIFGNSGNRVVIEEYLTGPEVSFMAACDGLDFVSLLPSQDHKRVFDDDKGPNTGGMGAYAPLPFVSKKLIIRIENEIVRPILSAMKQEGCEYSGILYPGIILTKDGPKVLEFNCRFGDPETQPLMLLLKSDIIDLFQAIIDKKLKDYQIKWYNGSAVCVVLTALGYPAEFEKGKEIFSLPTSFTRVPLAKLAGSVMAFHSGTAHMRDKFITSGGRVLGITGRGTDLKQAMTKVYRSIGKDGIHFSGMHYRKDIGKKGISL